MYTFKSELIKLSGNVWDIAIIVPTEIAENFLKINDKRVVCIFNNKVKLQAALMPKGKNIWFINLNSPIRKQLKVNEGDIIEVEITTDNSEYGMEVAAVFEELLQQDEQAKELFKALTIGKQRALIHQINTLKSEANQLKKALTMFDYLKNVNGKLDFKELNIAYKNSRF